MDRRGKVYINKNKGDSGERKSYRPTCLTQLVYNVWPGLVTRTLTKIMHILIVNNQFGYKQGAPAADALI